MTRRAASLLVTLLLALAVAACGGSDQPAQGDTLRVGVIVSGSRDGYGIESWAADQGILQRHLRDAAVGAVDFTPFPNGPNLNQALKGGALDLGVLGDTPAVSGRAAGLPTRLGGVSVRGQDAWLVGGRGLTSLADLRGKAVATQQGSYMHRYLVGLLDQSGLTGSVRITFLLANSAQQALDKGDIAAYAAPVPVGPLLQSRGYPVLDRASAHPGLTGNSYITPGTETLARHPGLIPAWNAAVAEAAARIRQDPSAYYAYATRVSGLPPDVVRAAYPVTVFGDPAITPGDVGTARATLDFLVGQRLAAGPFDVGSWVTTGGPAA